MFSDDILIDSRIFLKTVADAQLCLKQSIVEKRKDSYLKNAAEKVKIKTAISTQKPNPKAFLQNVKEYRAFQYSEKFFEGFDDLEENSEVFRNKLETSLTQMEDFVASKAKGE